MEKKLTRKQEAFCFEFCKDLNATQAAIRAGYSEKTAYSQGSRLMKVSKIVEKIDTLRGHVEMEAVEALRLLGKTAREAKAESVRLRALENVLKVHGLQTEKHEGEITFKVEYGDNDTSAGVDGQAEGDTESSSEAEGNQ